MNDLWSINYSLNELNMHASIDQLILTGESQTLEFKASFDKATVESLVAFANAQGGTVGITDKVLLDGVLWAI